MYQQLIRWHDLVHESGSQCGRSIESLIAKEEIAGAGQAHAPREHYGCTRVAAISDAGVGCHEARVVGTHHYIAASYEGGHASRAYALYRHHHRRVHALQARNRAMHRRGHLFNQGWKIVELTQKASDIAAIAEGVAFCGDKYGPMMAK